MIDPAQGPLPPARGRLSEMSDVAFRDVGHGDIGIATQLHRLAFKDFFMSKLGDRFLRQYYSLILDYEAGIFLSAAKNDGQLVGFAAGFGDPQGFYRSLRERSLRLALASLPGLVRQPSLLVRLVSNRRRTGVLASDHGEARRRVELASIAVAPAARRHGIGQRLVAAFCDRARSVGASEVYLTTEAEANEAVHSFYRTMGFRAAQTVALSHGRSVLEYRMDLELRDD